MKYKFIIIAILIFLKIIGVASHVRAESLTCPDGTKYSYKKPVTCIYKYGALTEHDMFLLDPNNPKYRCGKTSTNEGKIK